MNKRKNTRSQVWPDTKATIKVAESYGGSSRSRIKITGNVQNLGSNGFFIETDEIVPIPSQADIIISFDPESKSPGLTIQATGETVHISKGGIGIRFTNIDLNKLQKCIIGKMNKLDEETKYKLTGV
ncbi:MAG: hypothetical protein HF978_16205 [Desulfobacteraceae bacterium]|nr:PilZ domain-containing protein [Desulfobacteraceae bacterium]MBC2757086.1 hypothetical protein [Desulfobacteraceae bacterium]MBC2763697.1 hypothetical protein [ANME-2 cluster archaeon]